MATTLEIVDAVVARLAACVPDLAAEHFPEAPAEYQLTHPVGALLVSYAGSSFATTVDSQFIAQPRTLKFTVTIVVRQLNGAGGAVDATDAVRAALLGWRAPDCRKTWAVAEKFLGEAAGLWQYAVDLATEAMVIEVDESSDPPPLKHVSHEEVDS